MSDAGSVNINTKNALRYIVVFQYVPRMLRIFPLLSKIISSTGVLLETAWAGAAFNLLMYMLASHVSIFTSHRHLVAASCICLVFILN
jgi:cyclic nucleotide gated channel